MTNQRENIKLATANCDNCALRRISKLLRITVLKSFCDENFDKKLIWSDLKDVKR